MPSVSLYKYSLFDALLSSSFHLLECCGNAMHVIGIFLKVRSKEGVKQTNRIKGKIGCHEVKTKKATEDTPMTTEPTNIFIIKVVIQKLSIMHATLFLNFGD